MVLYQKILLVGAVVFLRKCNQAIVK